MLGGADGRPSRWRPGETCSTSGQRIMPCGLTACELEAVAAALEQPPADRRALAQLAAVAALAGPPSGRQLPLAVAAPSSGLQSPGIVAPQPSTPGAAERRSIDHRPDADALGAAAAGGGSSSGGSEYHAAPSEPSSSFESVNRVAAVAGQQYVTARRSSRRRRQLEKEDLRREASGDGDSSTHAPKLVPPAARVVRDSSGSVSAWLVASASATAGVPPPIGPDAAAVGNATCAAAPQAGAPSLLLPSTNFKTAAEPAAAQPSSKSRGSSSTSTSSDASSRRRFFRDATSSSDGKPELECFNPITALARLLRF